jgi:MFS transporter, DHA1 family, tetracycline resistance protein
MNKVKLAIIFTVFIDVIGVGIVIPVLPFYVASFGARPFTITLLFSVFALCSLISAPYLGALSDRLGRRPVLITSILSTSIGWFVFAAAPNILFLFVGRIIDGMAAGNISTAQSYLVDISKDHKERTTNLGLIGAAFGIGFVIGPSLGGLLSSVSPTFPFYVVGTMALINAIIAYFFLPETNKNGDRKKKIEVNPLLPLRRAAENKKLRPLYSAWFLFALAVAAMQSVFALYVQDAFGFGPVAAGLFFAVFGIIVAFNQGVALKRFWLKYFHEPDLLFWLLLGNTIGFLLIGVPLLVFFVIGQIIQAFSQSVFRVVMSSQVISNVAEGVQGETMGIMNSILSLAMVIGPIISGALYEHTNNFPFFFSALCVFVAFIFIHLERRRVAALEPIADEVTSV